METTTRTPITDAVKASITTAFKAVPHSSRGALLILADEHGARIMVAAKFGSNWKVAAEGSRAWTGPVSGTVSVIGYW
jgi:hypothetical protein